MGLQVPATRPRACVRLASARRSGASQSGSHGAALRTRTVKEALVAWSGGYSCPRPTSPVREGRVRCGHDAVSVCLCLRLCLSVSLVVRRCPTRPCRVACVWEERPRSGLRLESRQLLCVMARCRGTRPCYTVVRRESWCAFGNTCRVHVLLRAGFCAFSPSGRRTRRTDRGLWLHVAMERWEWVRIRYLVCGSGASSLYSLGTDGQMSGECACQENSGSVQTQELVWHWQAKIVTVGQSLTMDASIRRD